MMSDVQKPICQTAGCERPSVARSLCSGCYNRLRRRGTVERKNVINTGRCSVPGCEKTSHAKNLCSLHYQQQLHPLRSIWYALRARYPGHYPKEWDDLDVFVSAVGERPSPKHQLRRISEMEDWSDDNWQWLAPIGLSFSAERAQYMRLWALRRRYGLEDEEVEALVDEQGGLCPICQHELANSGKVTIDHDHRTGIIRGVLHDRCNKILGMADDDVDELRRAADFVEKYRNPENHRGYHRKIPKA